MNLLKSILMGALFYLLAAAASAQTAGATGNGTVYRFAVPMDSSPIPLGYPSLSTHLILNWSSAAFSLQSATNVGGAYTNVPGATSPFTNPIAGNRRFFRLIGNKKILRHLC